MSWITLLWLVSISPSIFGNQHLPIEKSTRNFSDLVMTASTSAVQANPPKPKTAEDKKTLAQQVAEGKYGLLQKEFFKNPPQRPGVLSYDDNNEVPKDNVKSLGGLNKSEIWLAENHLLVLRGGVFPLLETLPEYSKPVWPPIDDFDAPRRQVKLPKHPKVPPPFPVQLTDGGPIQILGTNFTRTLNDSFFSPPYPVPPLEGYEPGTGPYFPSPQYPYPDNSTAGETPFSGPPYPGDFKPRDGSQPQFPSPVNGPFFDSLPPGSAILPPPNITDQYDEDDLSIYYPPPYSFYYEKYNATEVPPGPLVPGIVLPPPLDFFGILTPPIKTTTESPRPKTTPQTVVKIPTMKPKLPPGVAPTYYTTTFKPVERTHLHPQRNKSISVTILRPVKPTRKPPPIYIYDNNVSNRPFAEYGPPKHEGRVSVTTSKIPLRAYYATSGENSKPIADYGPPKQAGKVSVTTTKIPLRAYYATSGEDSKPFVEYGLPKQEGRVSVTTTKIPLRAYFTTSGGVNLVTRVPSVRKESYTTLRAVQQQTPKDGSQIYIYDSAPLINTISTPYPQTNFVNVSKNYYTETRKDPRKYPQFVAVQETPRQPQFYYIANKPYITPRPQGRIVVQQQPEQQQQPQHQQRLSPNFQTHIVKLQEQIHSYQRPKVYQEENYETNKQPSPRPVYQYSFEVANYKEQHDKLHNQNVQEPHQQRNVPKYSVEIEPAIELTTTENSFYQNTPAPIYYPDNYQREQPHYRNNAPPYNTYQEHQKYSVVTPQPLTDNSFKSTPNPVYENYYTKQEQQLFDDITMKYFTTFGKKIGSTSTTPMPTVEAPLGNSGHRQIVFPSVPQQIPVNQPPYISSPAIKDNILVNYVNEAPTQQLHHPQYIQLKQQPLPYRSQIPNNNNQQLFVQRPQIYSQPINENYRKRLPPSNVPTIQAISIPSQRGGGGLGEGKPGSFISYELPGDNGAHFYFLTPQLTEKNDRGGIAYYYTQPSGGSRTRQ